jgi:hypothetical protein
MERFGLGHVALYAKGHYKRSNNIWADLQKCFTADDFSGEFFDKYDSVHLLCIHAERIPYHGSNPKAIQLINDIAPENCWKRGYYTKDAKWVKEENLPEYDYWEAVARFYLSEIAGALLTDLGGSLPNPNPNVLPLAKYDNETVTA